MPRAFSRLVPLLTVFTALVATSGCGTGAFSKLYQIPTPAPSPVVSVTPSSVTLSMSRSKTATITASVSSGLGYFTAQTNDGTKATVATVAGQTNVFTVTAVGIGSCKVIVSDGQGDSASVSVAVTQ